MKCQYMDELTGGKGTVFATGTPVSNSMTELYTMMRYLQHGTLRQKGLTHFDQWASTFGETTTAIELAPEGTGYRARTRFAKFFNLPELMSMVSHSDRVWSGLSLRIGSSLRKRRESSVSKKRRKRPGSVSVKLPKRKSALPNLTAFSSASMRMISAGQSAMNGS